MPEGPLGGVSGQVPPKDEGMLTLPAVHTTRYFQPLKEEAEKLKVMPCMCRARRRAVRAPAVGPTGGPRRSTRP